MARHAGQDGQVSTMRARPVEPVMRVADAGELMRSLGEHGVARGSMVAVAIAEPVGLGVAVDGAAWVCATPTPCAVVASVEAEIRPRWLWWSSDTATTLLAAGVRVATCWDVAEVHRLVFGTWRVDPSRIWARLHDLPSSTMPVVGQLDLLGASLDADEGDDEDPVRPDGHLRPEWVAGAWRNRPERVGRWAATAWSAAQLLRRALRQLPDPAVAEASARSESAAELLAAELAFDGLPIDAGTAEQLITDAVGQRPHTDAEVVAQREARDAEVLRHAPLGGGHDLRNPAHVRSMLTRLGIDVPNTRAWRLEALRDVHPFVDALLTWRKAERMATTYGYGWLDQHVAGGRLRGAWSGSDGAAGRMTAQAGLHNMPADLRPAVAAEPGHVFVRADLGQIEPRVLAAVSGDPVLALATKDDDMYAPVASRLGVERSVAKVAVLAAMYGQTSGPAGQALHRMEREYPVAMQYLKDAAEAGRQGHDVRTRGGRLVRMWQTSDEMEPDDERSAMAARGRYARNAMVQGAAAELFKVWAVTVRARAAAFDARIVLCLHDELLVHAPVEHGEAVARVVADGLQEAAHRWMPDTTVRFVADVSVIGRWSDAKA